MITFFKLKKGCFMSISIERIMNESNLNIISDTAQDLQATSPGICSRIGQKGYAAVSSIGSFGAGIIKGAVTYGGLQAAYSKVLLDEAYNLKVFSMAIFEPSNFRSIPKELQNAFDRTKYMSAPLMTKEAVDNVTNSSAILHSPCPYKEYLHQSEILTGVHLTPELVGIMNAINMIAVPSIGEELVFRGLLQDVILKRAVGKIIQKVAPAQAGLVDSKIYTAVRIAITTYAFVSIHESNRGILSDEYVDMQLYATAIMGVAFGILKEVKGLSWAIGAHAINNLAATLPSIMMKC